MKKRTPAQQQYHEIKQQYSDAILLFRMGDFYEMFHEDAKTAHHVLGITLTARDKTSAHPIPMAGIPYHALDRYLPKLIDAGYKVAIAEQVGEVVPGTVVRREVTQVITPGTYLADDQISRPIVAVRSDGELYWTAHGESSIGSYQTGSFHTIEVLIQRLESIGPREVVVDVQLPGKQSVVERGERYHGVLISPSDLPHDPEHTLKVHTQTSTLDGYGNALQGGGLQVMSLLASYLMTVQGSCQIQSIGRRGDETTVRLDPLTIRNLELFASQYEGTKEHSLMTVIDQCRSVMGSRLLAHQLRTPTRDLQKLSVFHQDMQSWSTNPDREPLHEILGRLGDLSKLPARLLRGAKVQTVLGLVAVIAQSVLLDELFAKYISIGSELHDRLQHLLASIDPDHEQFFISGYDERLDHLLSMSTSVDQQILAYHQELIAHTGISGLRVKYTGTQGYCIETSKKDADKLLESAVHDDEKFGFQRRQSLKSAERFVTPYLSQVESSLHEARAAYDQRFAELLADRVERFVPHQRAWYQMVDQIAQHDLTCASCVLMQRHGWTVPTMSQERVLGVVQGRHPVVEKFLGHHDQFIPNDLTMGARSSFHLITGPNMGGKSTYLRQNALIVLLAHAGLPVPAKQATIPLVDGIYARVGSGDALAKNQSTFMTEMIEMANIINNATKDSFIVLDELGRGTSTYDGMSLAYALSINLCELKAWTLFATHYHELIALENSQTQFSNRHVSVVETDRDVVFMKTIVSGGADKSYGLHVARRAGIPDRIVDQAEEQLQKLLEERDAQPHQESLFQAEQSTVPSMHSQESLYTHIIKQLTDLEINELTPIDALVQLHQLKKQAMQSTT